MKIINREEGINDAEEREILELMTLKDEIA